MNCEFEISMMNKVLSLRSECCGNYMSCDLCPFSIDKEDSEVYECVFENPVKELVGSIFCEVDNGD